MADADAFPSLAEFANATDEDLDASDAADGEFVYASDIAEERDLDQADDVRMEREEEAAAGPEDHAREIEELAEEGAMPLEEILKRYGLQPAEMPSALAAGADSMPAAGESRRGVAGAEKRNHGGKKAAAGACGGAGGGGR